MTTTSIAQPDGGQDLGTAVVALARELEQLARQVAELQRLSDKVEALGNTVTRLVQAATSNEPKKTKVAPSWLDDDSGVRGFGQEVLSTLADWVEGIYLRYSDARLSDCWLWHADVVEELLWLHAAWLAAYDSDASATAAGDWHDRLRPGVVRRVREYAGMCSLEAHRPGKERHVPAQTASTLDAIPEIAYWWATKRNEPGPVPTDEQLAAAHARMVRRRR